MATISHKQTVIFKNLSRIKIVASRVLRVSHDRENLWENPPEATLAMKQAIKPFKEKFKSNEQWDGTFSL